MILLAYLRSVSLAKIRFLDFLHAHEVSQIVFYTTPSTGRSAPKYTKFKKGVSNLENAVKMMQIKEPYWYQNINSWTQSGIEQGSTQKQIEVAKKMLEENLPIETISNVLI